METWDRCLLTRKARIDKWLSIAKDHDIQKDRLCHDLSSPLSSQIENQVELDVVRAFAQFPVRFRTTLNKANLKTLILRTMEEHSKLHYYQVCSSKFDNSCQRDSMMYVVLYCLPWIQLMMPLP